MSVQITFLGGAGTVTGSKYLVEHEDTRVLVDCGGAEWPLSKKFGCAPEMAPGLKLFALHSADGTPIMLTDSLEAAVANAWSHELQTVSVH